MTPEVERFLDLATRELEFRPELREEARAELMSRISYQGVPVELLDLRGPIEVLEGQHVRSPWFWRGSLLGGILLLSLAFGISAGTMVRDGVFTVQAQQLGYAYSFFGSNRNGEPPAVVKWAKAVAPDLPLVSRSRAETAAALVENPDDAALFQEHLQREMQDQGVAWEMSKEQIATAARIDPDNAFYDFLQMEACADRAFGGASRGRSSTTSVTDEGEFTKALELFAKASAAGTFADRSGEIRRRQIDAFPRSKELIEDQIHRSFAGLADHYTWGLRGYNSASFKLLEAELDRRVASGDEDGILGLMEQWLGLARLLIEDLPHGGVNDSEVMAWISRHGELILKQLGAIGLNDQQVELRRMLNELSSQNLAYGARFPSGPASPSERISNWRDVPSDIRYEEMVPAGHSERAAIDRGLTLAGCLVALWLVAFTAFEAFRRSWQVKRLAKGLLPLFQRKDHWWIAGLGIALPWLWFLAITRLTPLGLRDLSIEEQDGVPLIVAMIQMSAAIIMGAGFMLWAAYWRWEKRGGFLCLRGGGTMIGLTTAIMAAAAIPLAGVIRYLAFKTDDETIVFLLGVSGLAATGLLWLIWIGVLNLFTPKVNALRANLVSRSVLVWYIVASLTMVVGAEVLRRVEHHWMARDRLLRTGTSETHLNALEERTAMEWHRVMSGILGKE